jgi:hypothetical protein
MVNGEHEGTRRCRTPGAVRITEMKEAPMRVTLTEPDEMAGSYVVREQRDDGTLVLRPETSEEAIEQVADRPMSGEEFLASLDRVAAASQRERR